MEITAITPQKHDKNRCNIEVDGRFYCGLQRETVALNRLKAGMSVSAEELSGLVLESEKSSALDKALGYLSSSMKTEREVRDYLGRKGYLAEVCDYVVEKLRGYGYLDDAAYSAAYVSSAGKRKGRKLIEAELRRKGVSEGEIGCALASLTGEAESAKAVLGKYLRGKETDEKTLRRAYSYLLGKGFDYDTAREAISSLGETDDAD